MHSHPWSVAAGSESGPPPRISELQRYGLQEEDLHTGLRGSGGLGWEGGRGFHRGGGADH